MRKILIPLLSLTAAVALLAPAQAATTHAVDVLDSRFEPAVLEAVAGDTVTWTWKGFAGHNVTAYQGATFSAPTKNTGSFSHTFGGGAVLYRCTIHSSLDQGRCTGMCGVISDDTTPPAAPTVSEPAADATVRSPARITGTAPDADRIVIAENGTQRAVVPVGTGGAWAVQIVMTDGPHTIDVTARNLLGISGAATTRSFTVDATAPTVAITSPSDLSLGSSPLAVSGTAADERALASVSVKAVDVFGAPVTTATAALAHGDWSATLTLAPGAYAITATATDAAGNATTTAPVRVLVL